MWGAIPTEAGLTTFLLLRLKVSKGVSFVISARWMVDSLRILSLNVWGVYYAKNTNARTRALGKVFADYDIVCLQEQAVSDDWDVILQSCHGSHPFHHRFVSSFVGSGLAVLSKYPIVHHSFQAFNCIGHADRPYQGDSYCNKGMGLCQIVVPSKGGSQPDETLFLYNVHTHAQYEKYSEIGGYENETYAAIRTAQVMQLAQYIVTTSQSPIDAARRTPRNRVLLCGDMNSGPDSPEMRLLKAYCLKKAGLRLQRAIPATPQNHTWTRDNQFNASATSYFRLFNMEEDLPVQFDHIIFSTPGMEIVQEGRAILKDNNFVNGTPISDHFGVDAILRCCEYSVQPMRYSGPMQEFTEDETDQILHYSYTILRDGADHAEKAQNGFLAASVVFLAAAAALTACSKPPMGSLGRAVVGGLCGFGAMAGLLLSKGNRSCEKVLLRRAAEELHLLIGIRNGDLAE